MSCAILPLRPLPPEFYKACNNLAITTPGGWGSPGHVGMKVVQPTDLNVPLSFQVNTDRGQNTEYAVITA